MKFKPVYAVGIVFAILIMVANFYFFFNFETKEIARWFYPIIILAIIAVALPILLDYQNENQKQKEIEEKFLEFVRALVGNVKSGIPIPKAIKHVSDENFGALSPFVKKLSNQIEWGISVREALKTFANDTGNNVIKRAIAIVIEAEKRGGHISDVLDSVTESVLIVKKMKEERRTSVYSQTVQGYIVFFIFIAIMLVLQIKLFPQLLQIAGDFVGMPGIPGIATGGMIEDVNFDMIFFSLIVIQGFFAGLMIGKFSEGTAKQGLIHSAILIIAAALIITTIKGGI